MDQVNAAKSTDNAVVARGEDIMGPEGVEERVAVAQGFVITLTQGGKFRAYNAGGFCVKPNCGCHKVAHPAPKVFNTKEEAIEYVGRAMVAEGINLIMAYGKDKGLLGGLL